ncbi:MAG: hypothetical protein WC329_04320 [Candidatus Omnitrophota bacterium]|jgi:hypothetical protein
MAKQQDPKTPERSANPNISWRKPSKPHFVKLAEGEMVEGVFQGMVKTQYGPGYKFIDEGGNYFTLGGNRAQLDQIFAETLGNPEGFNGDTVIGHYIGVRRLEDTKSKSGRTVAQYEIGHFFDKCPRGCKPPKD